MQCKLKGKQTAMRYLSKFPPTQALHNTRVEKAARYQRKEQKVLY